MLLYETLSKPLAEQPWRLQTLEYITLSKSYQIFKMIHVAHTLTLKAPFTILVVFANSVDQDQAAQNVQSDL